MASLRVVSSSRAVTPNVSSRVERLYLRPVLARHACCSRHSHPMLQLRRSIAHSQLAASLP
jgi:hypothetical protein